MMVRSTSRPVETTWRIRRIDKPTVHGSESGKVHNNQAVSKCLDPSLHSITELMTK